MSSLVVNQYDTNYHTKGAPIGTTLTKLELLDRLTIIDHGLKKSLNIRRGKNTAKKIALVEELKRQVEISADDTRIPFNLHSGAPVSIGCRYMSCVSSQAEEVVHLENQLNAALMYLSVNEGDDGSEAMSSESTVDSTISGPGEEDESLMVHDREVIIISKNQMPSHTDDPPDIFTSTKETTPLYDQETPTDKGEKKSSTRHKGILMNRMDNGNIIRDGCSLSYSKRKDPLRKKRSVRFCDVNSVRIIDAESSVEDRLAKARLLLNAANNSRQGLVRATVQRDQQLKSMYS